MQGLVCPRAQPLQWWCPQSQERTISFYQEKDLFPRASANIPRYRDKTLMDVLEHDCMKGTEHLTGFSGPLPQVCVTIALLFFMSQAGINTHYIAQASLKLMVRPQLLGITMGARCHTHLKQKSLQLASMGLTNQGSRYI